MKTNNNYYLAWYRKYRPQIFSDVVGQEYIVQSLKNIVQSQQYFHAFLFSGPRGTGKTSLAKIFANTINCQHKRDIFIPCDFCISNINNSLDIIEMDAASNNGVKEIRELIENIHTLPQHSPFKIYILDEAHMLTTSAFNAFLKTLEEPPRHVIFILATTEVHKIPLTILSRLQRYNFSKAKTSEIVNRLASILDREGAKYETNALESIAKLSEGSLRDAISLLEQCATYSNGNIEQQAVESLFGVTSNAKLISFINNLASENLKLALQDLHEVFNQNKQPRLFLHQLIDLIKSWLIYKTNASFEMISDFSRDEVMDLRIDRNFAYKSLLAIYETLRELIYKDNPLTYLELMAIKIISKKATDKTTIERPIPETTIYKNANKIVQQPSFQAKESSESKIKIHYQQQDNSSFLNSTSWKNDIEILVNDQFLETNIPEELQIKEDLDLEYQDNLETKTNQNNINVDSINDKTEQLASSIPNNPSDNMEMTNLDSSQSNNFETNLKVEEPIDQVYNKNLDYVYKYNRPENNITVDELMNLIVLGKRFAKNFPYDWKEIEDKLKTGLETYQFDNNFNEIISILNKSFLLLSDKTFLAFSAMDPKYHGLLVSIKDDVNLKNFIVKTFGYPMHFFAVERQTMIEAVNALKKIKEQGVKFEPKPLKPIEQTQVTKDEFKKMIFSK